ncbi:RDD family protein [Lysobacter humi (ex Lee et al. 2017)]
MDSANPYTRPAADVAGIPATGDEVLAGRGERLAAVLLDTLLMGMVMLPLMFATGLWSEMMANATQGPLAGLGTKMLAGVLGFAVFVAIQGYPLHTSAQTWGKRVLRIRIVRLDGAQPSLPYLLLRRYVPMQAVGLIPFLGTLLSFVDSLLIFRDDRRCGHDLIAGTRVVNVRPAYA